VQVESDASPSTSTGADDTTAVSARPTTGVLRSPLTTRMVRVGALYPAVPSEFCES